MLEDREALILPIRKMESIRKPSKKTQGKSWRYRWKRPCLVEWERRTVLKKLRETDDETTRSNNIQKTKHACTVEAHASTRKRLKSTLQRNHEDHIAESGFNLLKSLQFGAQVCATGSSDEKIWMRMLQWTKNWETLV